MPQALTEAKLRIWMQRLGPRLIGLSTGICRDRHRAEEIVQEAFVKLWQRPPDAGEAAFPSWLRRVVTNLSINALQRTKRPATLPEVETDRALHAGERPARPLEQREAIDRLRAALERLDASKRAILVLRAQEGLTYEQIAEHLDIPVGTVMSRLNRARSALAEELQRDAEASGDPVVYEFRRYKQA